jgi:hypothetical protein
MFAFRLDLPPRKGLVRALVEIVSRVRHPSLISYFDVREDRGYIFRTDDGAYKGCDLSTAPSKSIPTERHGAPGVVHPSLEPRQRTSRR